MEQLWTVFNREAVADILFLGLGTGSVGLRARSFNVMARGKGIGATGKIGERLLKLLGGESQAGIRTSDGMRFIDQLVGRATHESKVGYISLIKSVSRQIAKDAELIAKGRIDSSTWHFFRSPITGRVGARKPLLQALKDAGIKYTIH